MAANGLRTGANGADGFLPVILHALDIGHHQPDTVAAEILKFDLKVTVCQHVQVPANDLNGAHQTEVEVALHQNGEGNTAHDGETQQPLRGVDPARLFSIQRKTIFQVMKKPERRSGDPHPGDCG